MLVRPGPIASGAPGVQGPNGHVNSLDSLTNDLRVRIRRDGAVPASPRCVVTWMQRAQRARDNRALVERA